MSTTTATPTRQRYAVDQAEIARAVRLLIPAGAVVEVRALDATSASWRTPHTISGYFDDPDALAKAVASQIASAKGIYITANEINPALLARAANRLKDLGKGDPTTSDGDVVRRRWLLIDLDPARPAEISSSPAEHDQALAIAQRVSTDFQAQGWPAPILADSGNGAHLLWHIDLPVADGGLVLQCLQALAGRYDDALIHIDQKVFNSARIWKLYGTWAAKGDDVPDRPHRQGRLLAVPDPVQVVPEHRLRELAATRPQEATAPRGSQRTTSASTLPTFDLEKWISDHLPDADGPRAWSSQAGRGQKWVIECPWNSDHTGRCAWIAELGNGAITAGCQHNGCASRGWDDLRRLKEPGYAERADRRNGGSQAHGEPHTDALPEEPGWLADGAEEVITSTPATAASAPTAHPVTEIIAELEALRPADGGKAERTAAEARALDLVADCAGLDRTDLQRIESTLRGLGLPQEFTRNWRSAVREAARHTTLAADGEIFTDGRPASWPYLVDERRLWLLSEHTTADGNARIERTLVADFSATITEEAIAESGAKHWTLNGETATGLPFTFEIPALEYSDERVLRAKLTQAAGPRSPVRAKMAAHLPAAIQLCSHVEPRRLHRFERTGWDDAGHFLIPGREPAGVRIILQPTLPYKVTTEADLSQGLAALTDLIEAMGPERTMIILGAMVIGPLARLAGWDNERSALFIAGRTGTLKTSTLQGFMSIWGPDFLRDDRLIRWGEGATANAVMAIATYASDLPLAIDNYKPGVAGGSKTFRQLIHAIVEGSEKLRLKATSDLREQKLIACWPCFTGEDTPNDDAASLARVLVLRFDWPRGEANERLARAQSQAHHLNAIGRSLLDWLESEDCRPVISEAVAQFATLRSTWSRRIVEANPHATNPLRVASNITTNQLAIWILQHHPTIGPVIAPYLAQHQTGLLDMAIGMAQRTAESLEATRFLNTLQELLATEELVLIPETGKDPDGSAAFMPLPERRLGWRAEDGTIYLIGQKALSDVLRKLGADALGNISLPTLFDQIAALDLIASHSRDGGRHTKLVRIAADGGQPRRVLHLKAAALEFSEEQADA